MKINKQKIIKYVGAGVLTTVLASGVGVTIGDMIVDHTQEICPICNYTTDIPMFRKLGITHQINQIENEYNRNGVNVNAVFNPNHKDKIHTVTKTLAIQSKDENGNTVYSTPIGYRLEKVDDVYYAVKNTISFGPSYEAFEINFADNVTEAKTLKLK